MLLEKLKLFAISSFSDEVRQDLFCHVWHHYSKRIMFYISLVVPRWEADSEDIFQEIMLKIYRNLEHRNPLRSFRAWVFAISRNHCLDYLKTKARRVNPTESTHQVEVPDNRTPEQLALRDEFNRSVHDLLQAL